MGEGFPQTDGHEEADGISNNTQQPDSIERVDLSTDEWAPRLADAPIYKKVAAVHAEIAQGGEVIQTVLADGTVETTNTAEPGDAIVTNPGGEKYIIKAHKFGTLYDPTDEEGVYKAKGKIRAIPNPTGQPIRIMKSWGEQIGDENAFIAATYDAENPDVVSDIRIIGRDEFNATYATYHDETQADDAWHKAHDEKYAREGRTGLLEDPEVAPPIHWWGTKADKRIKDLHETHESGNRVIVRESNTASVGYNLDSREVGERGSLDDAYEHYLGCDHATFERILRLKYDIYRIEDGLNPQMSGFLPNLQYELNDIIDHAPGVLRWVNL